MNIEYQDDDIFYSSYYGILLEQCDTNLSEKSTKELEIYITTFDGLLYVKYQIKTLKYLLKHVNFEIIFCDTNSHINPETSEKTKELCEKENVGYIKMPHNKFQDLECFSFKLGTDLNWIWKNCIKIRQPKYFAFLDQDCFLIKDSWEYLKSYLEQKGMYGLAWPQEPIPIKSEYWLIHIMNNFFKYEFVKNRELDFRPAGFVGLDTSGCNYFSLFKDYNRLDFIQNETTLLNYVGEEWNGIFREFTLHDDNRWIHIRNSTKPFTNIINEKESKEKYMSGLLDGIMFSLKINE